MQNRGGKGVAGMETKDSDNVYQITSAMAHDYVLFYTNQGRVFQTRVWEVPQGSRISKGKAMVNLLTLRPDEKVTSFITYSASTDLEKTFVLMCTKKGTVKKTKFTDFANIRTNGIIAIKLDSGDELLWVKISHGNDYLMLISSYGKAIILNESEIRSTGRSSRGVRGMNLESTDEVSAADIFSQAEFKKNLFVVGERGVGKKTSLSLFKGQHRGGKGVKVASMDEKIGQIAFAQIINDPKATVIITSSQGQVVKIPISSIPSRSRTAKGVILMRFSDKTDKVVSATFI